MQSSSYYDSPSIIGCTFGCQVQTTFYSRDGTLSQSQLPQGSFSPITQLLLHPHMARNEKAYLNASAMLEFEYLNFFLKVLSTVSPSQVCEQLLCLK